MTKTLQLQTKYMSIRQTRITIHGVPLDINEDYVGAFLALHGQVEEVAHILSKAGVPSGQISIQVILYRIKFQEIPNILV